MPKVMYLGNCLSRKFVDTSEDVFWVTQILVHLGRMPQYSHSLYVMLTFWLIWRYFIQPCKITFFTRFSLLKSSEICWKNKLWYIMLYISPSQLKHLNLYIILTIYIWCSTLKQLCTSVSVFLTFLQAVFKASNYQISHCTQMDLCTYNIIDGNIWKPQWYLNLHKTVHIWKPKWYLNLPYANIPLVLNFV